MFICSQNTGTKNIAWGQNFLYLNCVNFLQPRKLVFVVAYFKPSCTWLNLATIFVSSTIYIFSIIWEFSCYMEHLSGYTHMYKVISFFYNTRFPKNHERFNKRPPSMWHVILVKWRGLMCILITYILLQQLPVVIFVVIFCICLHCMYILPCMNLSFTIVST